MRYVLCLMFLVLAAVCGYGLLASFEPGTAIQWKVGYATAGIVMLSLAALSLRLGRRAE